MLRLLTPANLTLSLHWVLPPLLDWILLVLRSRRSLPIPNRLLSHLRGSRGPLLLLLLRYTTLVHLRRGEGSERREIVLRLRRRRYGERIIPGQQVRSAGWLLRVVAGSFLAAIGPLLRRRRCTLATTTAAAAIPAAPAYIRGGGFRWDEAGVGCGLIRR